LGQGILHPNYIYSRLIQHLSTGGLITLGLGAMNWTVDECLDQFTRMVNDAFTRRTGSNLPGFGFLIDNFNHSRYETKPLEKCLKEAFTEEQYLFGGRRPSSTSGPGVKIAVTATSLSGRTAIVLGNYNRVCSTKCRCLSSHELQRPMLNPFSAIPIPTAGKEKCGAQNMGSVSSRIRKQKYADSQ
jgi:hypothetical protein